MEMYNSDMFDNSQVQQQQQPAMYDPQAQQQQSDMLDPQVQQQCQNLQEISTRIASSESDFKMRNENEEDSTGNENAEVVVEASTSPKDQQSKKQSERKGRRRHTLDQIQQMETFYQECSTHPDADQRRMLAKNIGLTPMQIKFWFQNKNTQIKAEQKREEYDRLISENERIVVESEKYKEALTRASCAKCGCSTSINVSEMSFEEQCLRIENGKLNDAIARLSGRSNNNVGSFATSFFNKPLQNEMHLPSLEVVGKSYYTAQSSKETYNDGVGGGDVVRPLQPPTHYDKPKIMELVVAAIEELTMLAKPGLPFWIPSYSSEILNVGEYMNAFPMGIYPKLLGFRTEASRESMVVFMNHMNLIEILIDVNQWMAMFFGIVKSGRTLEVLSSGVEGSYDGHLQVMSAEFQIPSPLIPTRENYFVRYCKKLKEGSWAVVDVSLDHLRPSSTLRSRRQPSGCIIHELPHGYSKVIWVEHVDVDDKDVTMHNPYIFLEKSCLAFGAKRWLASLGRQCKRLASVMAINIPTGNLYEITSLGGRRSMLRLAERMMIYFCTSVGASKEHVWTPINHADNGGDFKVMTKISNDEPGRPCGIVLSVASSFWLTASPKRVFDFLQDNTTRNQWDILSTDGIVQEVAHIANDYELSNCVSLLRVNNESMNPRNMFILQESCIDFIGGYVIYSPIDVAVTNLVLSGGDPNYITLLPSGFAIFPDGHRQCGLPMHDAIRSGGCMLTTTFQILADATPTTKLSPTLAVTFTNIIKQSIRRIKLALS